MNDNDGGPAFPIPGGNWGDSGGMSLRDYFAAQAAGCIVHHNFLIQAMTDEEAALAITNVAALSFRLADAMLKERAK